MGAADGEESPCACHPAAVRRYVGRVSGPLLDRIDMHLDVPAVRWRDLKEKRDGKPSAHVRARVTEARERAAGRLAGRANAEMGAREIAKACRLDALGEGRLRAAVERFGLSARAYHRILRVARTIADLAGRDRITPDDLAEAIQYRVPAGR